MQQSRTVLMPLALACALLCVGPLSVRAEPAPRERAPVDAAVAAAAAAGTEPLAIGGELMTAGYPVGWVVEEIVFRYGDLQLPELVGQVRFLYGQSVKDLVRDAVRRGAARRFVERERMCRALREAGDGAAEVAGRPVSEARAICAWDAVDWNLVAFGEGATDLHNLLYNDDPGAYVSAQ